MRVWGYHLFCGVITLGALCGLQYGLHQIALHLDTTNDPQGLAIFLLICLLGGGLFLALAFIADVRAGRVPGRGRPWR